MQSTDVSASGKNTRTVGKFVLMVLYLVSLGLPSTISKGGGGGWFGGGGPLVLWGWQCLCYFPFVLLFVAWYANPIFFAGMVALFNGKRRIGLCCGIVATLLALEFSFILQPNDTLGPGYFTWLGCMIGLTAVSAMQSESATSISSASSGTRIAKLNGANDDPCGSANHLV